MRNRIQRPGRTFRTASAFAVGAAAGSLLALLYAPASGQTTRRRLGLQVRRWQRGTLRGLGQAQRVLVNGADRVREAATGWISGRVPQYQERSINGRQTSRRRIVRHAVAH